MVFGLKVSEIPPFVGKKVSSFTVWKKFCIVNRLGINLESANEHVPEIERKIRVAK